MSKKHLALLALIIAKFFLQYFLLGEEYDLHRDEYLHLDQAHHMAWGYSSVPPFTACLSWLILQLGNSVFWVKFFPALFGALTILVVWKAIEELKGGWFALLLGGFAVLLSSLLRINMLYQPNTVDLLCWTTFYFFVLKYIHTRQNKWLYFTALIFAIGFLNKYNIAFLVIGLLPAVLLSQERKLFINKHLYLAILTAFILILPNLIWQYQNHFPVVHHMQELAKLQLVNVNKVDFLIDQILFFLGAIPLLLGALYAFIFYKPFAPYRLYAYAFIITISVFVLLRAKSYYAIGIYPIYIGFGAVFLEQITAGKWKMPLRTVLLIFPFFMFSPVYRIAFPNHSPQFIYEHPEEYKKFGLLRWEDGKDHDLPQDFADMLGWKELAQKVDAAVNQLPEKNKTLILCDNYGQAGAINYYSKNKDIRAVAFNADYLGWFDLDTEYHHLIRVKEKNGSADEMALTAPYFESAVKADAIENTYAREYGTTIFVFRKAKIDIRDRLKQEIEDVKWW